SRLPAVTAYRSPSTPMASPERTAPRASAELHAVDALVPPSAMRISVPASLPAYRAFALSRARLERMPLATGVYVHRTALLFPRSSIFRITPASVATKTNVWLPEMSTAGAPSAAAARFTLQSAVDEAPLSWVAYRRLFAPLPTKTWSCAKVVANAGAVRALPAEIVRVQFCAPVEVLYARRMPVEVPT